MAAQESSGVDSQKLEALAKQLGDLERQATDVSDAIQRAASVRRILTLAVVGVLAVFLTLYYKTARSFLGDENLDQLIVQLNLRAAANSEDVINQLHVLVDHTKEPLAQAFNEQFQKDMPTILAKLGPERENLAVNLQSRLDDRLQDQYNKALESNRQLLKEEFKIEDDETLSLMIHHFEGGFQPLVKQYYGDKLKAEFNRMYATWDDFPLDDSKRSREELEKELYRQLVGLMMHRVSAVGAETAATAPPGGGG